MRNAARTACALAALAVLVWRAGLPPAPPAPPAEARAKLAVLREILASRDDNDPRLDSDFRDLTPADKALLRREYAALPPEARNERGTIVYLLGRSLADARDWAFLRAAAAEPPCLSLADCARLPAPGDRGDEDPGDAVTLAYPSLVALKMAEGALTRAAPGSPQAAQAWSVIRAGRGSKSPAAARLALRLSRRYAP